VPPVPPPSERPVATAAGPTAAAPSGADASSSGLLFPVVGTVEKSLIQEWWEKYGLGILAIVFVVGLGLAFTPCVLPIIPITVSIIGGGRADLPKSRLTVLLVSYVLGLSSAFGSSRR
jgi:thiol:disulfide interchange protein DsbD